MEKMINANEFLEFVSKKAIQDDITILQAENLYWLQSQFEEFYKSQGKSFEYNDDYIDMVFKKYELLKNKMEKRKEILSAWEVEAKSQLDKDWKNLEAVIEQHCPETGSLLSFRPMMAVKMYNSSLTMFSMRKTVFSWEERMISLSDIDEKISSMNNDILELQEEFDMWRESNEDND